jgi:hypothetical protein
MNHPIYCEQPIYQAFFEPINTITNLAFMIAGVILFTQLKKKNLLDIKGIYFSSLLIVIGLGSFAWHLYRSDVTVMLDSIPIAVFVLTYLFFYIMQMNKNWVLRIGLFLSFFGYVIFLTKVLSEIENYWLLTNGGMQYIVALSFFVVLQIFNRNWNPALIKPSFIVVLLFAFSIFFRQTDLLVCEYIGFGTHFMWHILNGVVLYLFVRMLYISVLIDVKPVQ